ncbi:hypothetical protein GXW77_04170 [Roseomonas alkaliterrae]|uniref:Uncharacterized protein n=1 Tax=Neoroseomonas alkaliterrae TaxID=1452450 RepID=A0A840Y4V8_9PROT|nr:hypothetical protein [Neoroseomonas alkaliterrae]MBB5689163.1 hypothetical protein [Neoroseomonas alkaliterrae]MBR0675366.1 hypothetical protein [Neoroseomonas alkaliterrae]
MILRLAMAGMAGAALAGAAAVATGLGVAALACAVKRRAEARAAWPEESAAPADGAQD